MEPLLTPADERDLAARGIAKEEVRRQVALFRNPPPPADLVRPCTVGDGVVRIAPEDHEGLLKRWKEAADAGRLSKFVPASGAATRMFAGLEKEGTKERERFLEERERFPFLGELEAARQRPAPHAVAGTTGASPAPGSATLEETPGGLLGPLLSLPKGLIPFHRYGGETRTPFEEHLVEATQIVKDSRGVCRVHFTVSPEHEAGFLALFESCRPRLERELDARLDVTFSHQSPCTDTVAVDLENRPFRLADGTLLFRPGGHGALLANLQELGGDVVFIKNIDNVQWEKRARTGFLWKKALAGYLVSLEDGASAEGRPVRVCGVVKNEGEPGGGPFWVRGADGRVTPQIVESAQVDMSSAVHKAAWAASTHFNPVDLVCSVRDANGRPYRLADFVDENTVFISKKSKDGRELKALERPGLWNGAMAKWKTVFVEIPKESFTPVKTVFDLLRPEHQPA